MDEVAFSPLMRYKKSVFGSSRRIGCGGMGTGDLRDMLRSGAQCVALCAVDDAQSAEVRDLVGRDFSQTPELVTRDFRRVLDRSDIDAVIVATPDHWHALPTVMACEAGKDVYVEKPLSLTIGEGRVMVDVARRQKRVVQMGTQHNSGAPSTMPTRSTT
jgi:predicted dehydrogenase